MKHHIYSPLIVMPIRHARESSMHREGKQLLGLLLSSRQYHVLFEHRLSDVVAFKRSANQIRVVCGEHELTNRNVHRNVRRNIGNRCDAIVILVPSNHARASVRRLLQRTFPREVWNRIGIVTHEACCRRLQTNSADYPARPN